MTCVQETFAHLARTIVRDEFTARGLTATVLPEGRNADLMVTCPGMDSPALIAVRSCYTMPALDEVSFGDLPPDALESLRAHLRTPGATIAPPAIINLRSGPRADFVAAVALASEYEHRVFIIPVPVLDAALFRSLCDWVGRAEWRACPEISVSIALDPVDREVFDGATGVVLAHEGRFDLLTVGRSEIAATAALAL